MNLANNLALPSSKLPLVYRNPLSSLVTALPYIDQEIDHHTRLQVQENINKSQKIKQMIAQEMKNMDPIDYLADLPMPQIKESEFIKQEMERIKSGKEMDKIIFEQNHIYKNNTINEVQESIEDINKQISYTQINLLNQELLNKYGKDSWHQLITYQENEKQRLDKQIQKSNEELTHINAQRKYEQNEIKYKIDHFKARIAEILQRNEELEIECFKLEEELQDKALKKLKVQ